MKKLALAALALTSAASVFAQGTIVFDNRNSVGTSHIYAPLPGNTGLSQSGNGSADSPSGSTSWAGFSAIGAGGFTGQYGGSTTLAQLLGANGSGDTEASLTPQSGTITFRTGAGAGFLYTGPAVTLNSIPLDSAAASFQVVAWDDSSGLYSTWTLASAAWAAGTIAAGESTIFTVAAIGGNVNTPPAFSFPSFNLYTTIPEPSTFALAGLGAAAMLIFRRRKQ
jgi:hypothetical protein